MGTFRIRRRKYRPPVRFVGRGNCFRLLTTMPAIFFEKLVGKLPEQGGPTEGVARQLHAEFAREPAFTLPARSPGDQVYHQGQIGAVMFLRQRPMRCWRSSISGRGSFIGALAYSTRNLIRRALTSPPINSSTTLAPNAFLATG